MKYYEEKLKLNYIKIDNKHFNIESNVIILKFYALAKCCHKLKIEMMILSIIKKQSTPENFYN
jgi:hypothetical protein